MNNQDKKKKRSFKITEENPSPEAREAMREVLYNWLRENQDKLMKL